MSNTQSLAFPKMFNIAANRVAVYEDEQSVANRSRLLILTEPTELYNEPDFGVGLSKYLWQYNTLNVKAIIQDKIVAQLDKWEPCVDAQKTQFSDGLLFSEEPDSDTIADFNSLKFSAILRTNFDTSATVDLSESQS